VTVLNRSDVMLRKEDADVAKRFTELLSRRVDVRLETSVEAVESTGDGGVRVHTVRPEGKREDVEAEVILIATGRAPNGDTLDLAQGGIEIDDDGLIVVDEYLRTSAAGVFALGDVCSHEQLKHVANKDARVVQRNLLHPDSMITSERRIVPHAVFSMPQVASVGLTEAQAEEQGIDYVVSRQDYGETAFGWAMEDIDHFVKIIADAKSKIILGAHLIGPQAVRPRSGPRTVLDPSSDDRGARERPAGPRRLSPRAPGRSPSVVNPASERRPDGIVGVHARDRLRLSGSHQLASAALSEARSAV
jgi:mycothione reductase